MGTLRFCHQPAVKVNFPVPVSPKNGETRTGHPDRKKDAEEGALFSYPATLEGTSFSREGENAMIMEAFR